MKLIEGLKQKGKPAEIIDTGRDDLPAFFKKMGYKVGVEIGVYKGEYTKKLLDGGLKIYGVDPWKAYGNYTTSKNLAKFQVRQDFLYDHTQRHLKEYLDSGQCELIRKTSMDAIEDFEDHSIDFVYIDGHHGFRYVAEDLVEWSRKVKPGGVVSGHDYALNKKPPRDPYVLQVKYVLHAYTEAFRVGNWFVLGRKNPPGERVRRGRWEYNGEIEIRDQWRSWMWVKKDPNAKAKMMNR